MAQKIRQKLVKSKGYFSDIVFEILYLINVLIWLIGNYSSKIQKTDGLDVNNPNDFFTLCEIWWFFYVLIFFTLTYQIYFFYSIKKHKKIGFILFIAPQIPLIYISIQNMINYFDILSNYDTTFQMFLNWFEFFYLIVSLVYVIVYSFIKTMN